MKDIALAFLLLSAISCKQSTNPTGPKIGEEFDLKYGQSTQVQAHDIISIKFQTVGEDSHCPKGADCLWEGNAKIIFLIRTCFHWKEE